MSGWREPWGRRLPDTRGMLAPAQCKFCGEIYDLGLVVVIGRYADCSTFESPCCKTMTDDRPARWGGGVIRLDRTS